jgi:protein-disulfide isomerase
MTCIHCANFHNNTLPEIKERYIDTGQARLIMREFPFDPRAEAGAMLARCADTRYHAMTDVLFRQYDNWVRVEDARTALLADRPSRRFFTGVLRGLLDRPAAFE